jgi:serine protease Do
VWRRSLTVVLATSLAVAVYTQANAQQPPYQAATAEFSKLPMDVRYEIQMLLISAGYSNFVSTDQFSSKVFDAIARFQINNGLTATGILTPDQFKVLHGEADPVLSAWGLQMVNLPNSGLH